MGSPSHPVAGGDIGDGEREERDAGRQHDGIEHSTSPLPAGEACHGRGCAQLMQIKRRKKLRVHRKQNGSGAAAMSH
jgi:hypothetical protein